MHSLLKHGSLFGRCFIAVAMIAFGVQHLVYADFVTRLAPRLPAVIPGPYVFAYIFGAYLVVSGLALFFHETARTAALILATVLLGSLTFLYLPALVGKPGDMGLWTKTGKALTFCGGVLLIAGSLPAKPWRDRSAVAMVARPSEKLIPFGRYFLAAFFTFCGVLHFFYVDYVAGLVPTWIPAPFFWTYFAGAALIASGLGISIPPTTRTAAALSALMVFLWVLLLHIPRAFANLRDSNETTAVFEALAVTGTALLVAVLPTPGKARQPVTLTDPAARRPQGVITVPNIPLVPSGRLESHRYETGHD
jgi:uncharacterized membrane protein